MKKIIFISLLLFTCILLQSCSFFEPDGMNIVYEVPDDIVNTDTAFNLYEDDTPEKGIPQKSYCEKPITIDTDGQITGYFTITKVGMSVFRDSERTVLISDVEFPTPINKTESVAETLEISDLDGDGYSDITVYPDSTGENGMCFLWDISLHAFLFCQDAECFYLS